MTEAVRHVRTFTGRTMDEALARVRGSLGPDAVILQARRVRARRWWGGRRSGVQVTAGLPAAAGRTHDLGSGGDTLRARHPKSTRAGGRPADGMVTRDPRKLAPSTELTQGSLALEVAELRGVVQKLLRRGESLPAAEQPEIVELRRSLEAQGLPGELVSGLVERVRAATGDAASLERAASRGAGSDGSSPGGQADDRSRARSSLLSLIERLIPTSGPVRLASRRCSRVALVGPTGVGKTTTIAKLAAHFRVRERRAIGLIAADTYRIAAVDQLKRYADLMGSPVRVVRSPGEIARAAAALAHNDVVFIDTAGRSHRDELRMGELRRLLVAARSDEVHLVLSLTSDSASMFSAIDRFAPLGANRLILTKLDEAECTGAILRASARARLPVSYVTTGQEVPEDIEVAVSRRLAKLVIDGPRAFSRRAWDGAKATRRSA